MKFFQKSIDYQKLGYLTTKRCLLDLLHFFVGFAILVFLEINGIFEKSFGGSDKSSQNECMEKWLFPRIFLVIVVVFSMALSFFSIFLHLFSKSVAKYEPRVYVIVMVPIYFLLFATVMIFSLHLIYYHSFCCTFNLAVSTLLILLQWILYASHSATTQNKFLLQTCQHPTMTPVTSIPPPPSYTSVPHLISSSLPQPASCPSADDDDCNDNDSESN